MQRIAAKQKQNKERQNKMGVKKTITKPVATPKSAQGEDAAAEAPKKKSRLGSLKDVFDSTKAGATGGWPDGDYIARLVGADIEEKDDSEVINVVFSYADPDGEQEKDQKQSYQLQDKDGNPGAGIQFLKNDLETLGYDDVPFDELEDVLAELAAAETLCKIKVKTNGRWKNAYLQGLAED